MVARQVWYQLIDPRGIEGLTDLEGDANEEPQIGHRATAGASPHCASRPLNFYVSIKPEKRDSFLRKMHTVDLLSKILHVTKCGRPDARCLQKLLTLSVLQCCFHF